jgi:hypothetical protein
MAFVYLMMVLLIVGESIVLQVAKQHFLGYVHQLLIVEIKMIGIN